MEALKKQAADKYGDIPLDVVYIYRSKPTLGLAIEGGANTRQPLPKVINVQVKLTFKWQFYLYIDDFR